jgi:hypothetical protein
MRECIARPQVYFNNANASMYTNMLFCNTNNCNTPPSSSMYKYVTVGLTLTGYTTGTFTSTQAQQLTTFFTTLCTNLWSIACPVTVTSVASAGSGAVTVGLSLAPPSTHLQAVQGLFSSQWVTLPQLFAANSILPACTAVSISPAGAMSTTVPVAYTFPTPTSNPSPTPSSARESYTSVAVASLTVVLSLIC